MDRRHLCHPFPASSASNIWEMCRNIVDVAVVQLFIYIVILAKSVGCDLYEGSRCKLENQNTGVCKKLPDCPSRYEEVRAGERMASSMGRCGFDGFVEIVCCPMNNTRTLRQAAHACETYKNLKAVELDPNGPHFIYHGNVVARLQLPFMAALGYQNTDVDKESKPVKYLCGGSLISLQHVLTAAHCVNNVDERVPIEVLLGTVFLRGKANSTQRIGISNIITHQQYKRSKSYNDVAILKLQTEVQVTTVTRPACLYTIRLINGMIPDNKFSVAGWGGADVGEDESEWLMITPFLGLVNKKECNMHYVGVSSKIPNGIDDTLVCAIDPDRNRRSDACHGDSGGPLLIKDNYVDYVSGITAFGQICGTNAPGVYTSVYPFLDWIEQIVWPTNEMQVVW